MSTSKTLELDFGRIEIREDGILRFVGSSHLKTVTLDQLNELCDALILITEGKPMPFYSDNSNMESLGYLERQFIGKNLHRFATASAVKENSSVIRFIGHTINHLFPPKVPMRMFISETLAIAWLKSVK